jgi:hypothetical protein
LTPKSKESEWFALYEITDKGTKRKGEKNQKRTQKKENVSERFERD